MFSAQIRDRAFGCAQPNISAKQIECILIPLPPLETQRKIAITLDKVSEILAMRKQQLAELDNLIKSTFYDMFGDPVANEKGWKKVNYSNITTRKPQNGFFAKADSYNGNGNAEVIWISDFIDRMSCDLTNLKRVHVTAKDIEKYQVSYGDMLFCRSSLNKAGIGKCSYVPFSVRENTIFECHIIKTSVDLNRVNPRFLQVQTTTDFFRNQVFTNAKTSTMTTIGQEGIINNLIILPPLSYQDRFAEKISKIEEQKELVSKTLNETQELFDSLMSRYFD